MYCGNNKIALSSQRQIADTLFALMQEEPFRDISISRICSASGISRQTFYSLFSSKENVVVFELKSLSCPEEDTCCEEDGSPEDGLPVICRQYSDYICRNAPLLKLLQDNGILHLLYDSIYETFSCCSCCCCEEDSAADRIYLAHYLAGSITGIVRAYIENGCVDDSEQLLSRILTLFGGSRLQ